MSDINTDYFLNNSLEHAYHTTPAREYYGNKSDFERYLQELHVRANLKDSDLKELEDMYEIGETLATIHAHAAEASVRNNPKPTEIPINITTEEYTTIPVKELYAGNNDFKKYIFELGGKYTLVPGDLVEIKRIFDSGGTMADIETFAEQKGVINDEAFAEEHFVPNEKMINDLKRFIKYSGEDTQKTVEVIDKMIREYGLSREEAEAILDIDLEDKNAEEIRAIILSQLNGDPQLTINEEIESADVAGR